MKTILSIEPYVISINEMVGLAEPLKNNLTESFFKRLPEYCIRDNNGVINYTMNYHWFSPSIEVSEHENKDYYFFNAFPVDFLLAEEISNSGLEDLFENIDFRPLFKEINPMRFVERKGIPHNTHVVVDLEYVGTYEDCELFVHLIGYLNGNLELVKL